MRFAFKNWIGENADQEIIIQGTPDKLRMGTAGGVKHFGIGNRFVTRGEIRLMDEDTEKWVDEIEARLERLRLQMRLLERGKQSFLEAGWNRFRPMGVLDGPMLERIAGTNKRLEEAKEKKNAKSDVREEGEEG